MKFFSLDSPFHKYGTILFDLIALSVLWFLLSTLTLGIGIGATTTALYYTIHRSINEDKGSVFKDFFISLKDNFFRATIIWIILLIGSYGLYLNIFVLDYSGMFFGVAIKLLSYVIALQVVFVYIYVFPLLAKIELKGVFEYLKVSVLLANKYPWYSFLSIIVVGIVGGITYMIPILGLVAISLCVLLLSKIVICKVIITENENSKRAKAKAMQIEEVEEEYTEK